MVPGPSDRGKETPRARERDGRTRTARRRDERGGGGGSADEDLGTSRTWRAYVDYHYHGSVRARESGGNGRRNRLGMPSGPVFYYYYYYYVFSCTFYIMILYSFPIPRRRRRRRRPLHSPGALLAQRRNVNRSSPAHVRLFFFACRVPTPPFENDNKTTASVPSTFQQIVCV